LADLEPGTSVYLLMQNCELSTKNKKGNARPGLLTTVAPQTIVAGPPSVLLSVFRHV
ncbi:hypothetical protein Y032_1347g3838, partial [Ancylostoma ceylanicum]